MALRVASAGYRPNTALLVAVMAGGLVGMTMILPSLPSIQRDLAIDGVTLQLTLTLYLVSYAAAQLLAGPLSDRFGRRPFILGGLSLFVFASLWCAIAPNIELLLLGRVLQGIGACSGMAVTRAMLRDVYATEETARIMAIVAMTMGLAPSLAPVIGGQIEAALGWRAVFACTALYALLVAIPAGRTLRETRPAATGHGIGFVLMGRGFVILARSRRFLAYAGASALTTAGFFAFLAASPLLLIARLGVAPEMYGVVTLIFPAGFMAGSFVSSRISRRVGLDRMILIGAGFVALSCAAAAALALAGAVTVAAVMAPLLFVGFGHGFVSPNALAGLIGVRPDLSGTASAVGGFLQMATGALISPVMGAFAYDTQLPLMLVMLALASGVVACAVVLAAAPRKIAEPRASGVRSAPPTDRTPEP